VEQKSTSLRQLRKRKLVEVEQNSEKNIAQILLRFFQDFAPLFLKVDKVD
jgi:hypothetical protein